MATQLTELDVDWSPGHLEKGLESLKDEFAGSSAETIERYDRGGRRPSGGEVKNFVPSSSTASP